MLELAPDLDTALSDGQTVVVPTAQRAAAIRLGFAAQQLARGRRAFRTPDVQSLSGWLRGQPAARGPDGQGLRRLGTSEEWLLWRDAVGAAAAALSLPARGLVDAVRRSAGLLYDWNISVAAVRHSGIPEALLLVHALDEIGTRFAERGAVASWRALHDLAQAPPRRAPVFAGFTDFTPARRALLEAWGQQGIVVRNLGGPLGTASGTLATAPDPAAELSAVARWCRERLLADPGARLLVIMPDLAQRQGEARRVFDSELGDQGGYAVEGGQALSDYAPVAEGLRTLRLLAADVEMTDISQWLRADFWVQPSSARRATLDAWLRGVVPPRLNAFQLLQALRAAPPALLAHADEVAAHLARLQEAFGGAARSTLGAWSARFAQVLALCGLHAAAARERDSRTQQIVQRLDELLQECAALPADSGVFGAGGALSVFTQLLARTRFEPATGDAAVTITASLVDPLLRYDGIWASCLHAGVLPEPARFDPFIPVSLQREAGLTMADPAALLAKAERALDILARSTGEFIVSAPQHAADLELVASPLLAPYAQKNHVAPGAPEEVPQLIRASRRIETFVDAVGTPWVASRPFPGGARSLELQSHCPFRAYAKLRLHAEPLGSPVPGISPAERGRMLHRAVELLWQRLRDSSGLTVARDSGHQAQIIDDCIGQAAAEVLQGTDRDAPHDAAFSPAADATGLRELRRAAVARELGRAARLLDALCELEASRPPFVVQELESDRRLQVGGGIIDLRIDRIDRLDDGTHAIVDYKSGRAVTPDWDSQRSAHPQLLVYQFAARLPVSALVMAHLHPKQVEFRGLSCGQVRLPGVPPATGSWPARLQAWNAQVARLAGDFLRGDARVDPLPKICERCHLHAFCRIADQDSAAQDAA